MSIKISLFASSVLMAAGLSTQAMAQEAKPDDASVQEIVVTAQRTQSLASKTPVALTAVGGEDLRKVGIDSPSALGSRVPNLQMDQSGTALRITIRGVTSQDTSEKGDPSAAFMQDGIYIARSDVQNVAFYDIARVEVLRGPQGTLYGRNTTAGAVNVISNEPKWSQEGALHVTLGDYATRNVDGMYNLPLNDKVAVRAAFSVNKHDSYIRDGQGAGYDMPQNRDDASIRLSTKIKFSEQLNVLLRADYSDIHTIAGDIPTSNFYSAPLTTSPVYLSPSSKAARTLSFPTTAATRQANDTNNDTWGIGGEVNWDLGPATLTYQGSHREFNRDEKSNFILGLAENVYLGGRAILTGKYKQDSHELRVAATAGPLTAQAGAYYFKEVSNINYTLRDLEALVGVPYYAFPQGPTTNISRAVFTQATYSVLPTLRLTAGVRYSEDEKSRYGASILQQAYVYNASTDSASLNAAALKTNKTIWRLGADYDLTPATLLYGVISTGYKAGGFNDGCLVGSKYNGLSCTANTSPKALFYQPEELTSYEVGIKTRFWDNRARLNVSAFAYDYTNLQLSGVLIINSAPQLTTTNAASANIKGIEAEGELRLTSNDRINYSLALLDAKYDSYKPDGTTSWSGVRLDRSPKTVFTLGYDRSFNLGDKGRVTASVFTRWTDDYLMSVPSKLIQYRIPSYFKSDASLSYTPADAPWDVQIFAKNLENKVVPVSITGSGTSAPSEPRTMGLRVNYNF